MSRFNLIDEKWIPVRFSDGVRDELGIRDTLLRAKEIAAIEDHSPLVMAALHRFLLAVLYRALEGPTDINQAKVLFKQGLPHEKITVYLEKWRDRFWLFNEKYPFYQVPDYKTEKRRSWAAMAAEHNADNAKVLFDHLDVTESGEIASRRAACWLLACQTFALGGGKSDFQYTKGGPSATAVMVLPLGRNLESTLILSLVPENREVFHEDVPIWERESESFLSLRNGMKRSMSGWADLYTWRTRSIKFHLDGDGDTIGELAFASGIECLPEGIVDPMVGYKIIRQERGKQSIRFHERGERGYWRDFDSLLPDNGSLAPKVIEHATNLTRRNLDHFPKAVLVLGQANDQAKVKYWRMERFALPQALAGNRNIRTEIRQLLKDAEETRESLWKASRSFARELLSRGDRKPDEKDIKNFVEQMHGISWYWSTLEFFFHQILREYTLERDSEDIRYQWLTFVRDTLKHAWERHRVMVSGGDAWAIRAFVKSEKPIKAKLRELNDEILELEPQEENV